MSTREIKVELPVLHLDQMRAHHTWGPHRFKAIRCGRRWGKTRFSICHAAAEAVNGGLVGWFAPDYKKLKEPLSMLQDILKPITARKNETQGIIECITKGSVEFWTLADENAGRSRKYSLVIIDEAAFGKRGTSSEPKSLMETWRRSIKPTMLDFAPRSRAIVLSNSAGEDPDDFFYQICTQPEHGFREYWAPTRANPYMPREELDEIRRTEHPKVWEQEYEAKFVDWSGDAFFLVSKLMDQATGQPFPMPERVDAIYAVVDTAAKTKRENDGTAVVYFGLRRRGAYAPRLYILDWDYQQIEGSLLERWLPGVFHHCETLARQYGAVRGSIGTWIEDKSTGMVLLQQARRNNWPAREIDSDLTAVGKVERAVSVSRYVYGCEVGMALAAYQKVLTYKGATRNHLLTQISGFRVADKEDRDDDLLDCFTYGISIGLGNRDGY